MLSLLLLAPVFWFSPDEPSLLGASGPNIRIPEPLPGESRPDRPVLYYQVNRVLTYQVNRVLTRPGAKTAAVLRTPDRGASNSSTP